MLKFDFKTTKDILEHIDTSEELFFDTETDGLYGKIMLAQFYQKGWDSVALIQKPSPMDLMLILSSSNTVMHNSSYDLSTIQRQSSSSFVPERFEDTLYLSRLKYYEKQEFSLDKVMDYVLDYDPYKKASLIKKDLQKSDWSGTLTEDQKLYASIDVFYLPNVYYVVKSEKENYLYKLDMISLKEALLWQCNGFPVDKDKLNRQYITNEQLIQEQNLNINCNSYLQVRQYIGSENSDDIGLALEIYNGNARALKVRTVRKLEKQQSFIRKFDSIDSKIYGIFAPSARSGRYTCRKDNLQQNPRSLKHVFGLPSGSDKVIVYSDYPGLELRGACAITGEAKMEVLFRESEDLHNYTAIMLFGKCFTKDERQIAKTANFALLYGASYKILGKILLQQCGLHFSESELRKIQTKWNSLWTTITKWQQDGIKRWRAGMIGSTPLGRKYKAKMMTDYLNIQVQGFGAEVAKLAMHYIIDDLKEIGWYNNEVKLINFVHDSYFLLADNDNIVYEKTANIVAKNMQVAWFSCCTGLKIPDLPMPVSVTVGSNVKGIDGYDYIYKHEIDGMNYYNKEGIYER